jgi:hypothetical protein
MAGTLRRELPDRLLIVSEHRPRRVLTEYRVRQHRRPRRALDQLSTEKQVLGALAHEYQIAA